MPSDSPADGYLTVADLAAILCLKPQTIYNRLCSRPDSLPPPSHLPCTRGPRWSRMVVNEWRRKYDPGTSEIMPSHRGRPTKAEQIARRRLNEAESGVGK